MSKDEVEWLCYNSIAIREIFFNFEENVDYKLVRIEIDDPYYKYTWRIEFLPSSKDKILKKILPCVFNTSPSLTLNEDKTRLMFHGAMQEILEKAYQQGKDKCQQL